MRKIVIGAISAVAATFLAATVFAQTTKLTYEDLWSAATAGQHALTDYGTFTMVETGNVYHYFTKPEHEAHPAVVRRSLVERDGRFFVETEGWSFKEKAGDPAFQRWMAEFEELNRRMMESLGQQ